MPTHKIRGFQRGQSTYTCHACGKLTRNTEGSEGGAELCADCFNAASLENLHGDDSDHHGDFATCPLCDMEGEYPGLMALWAAQDDRRDAARAAKRTPSA